MRQEMTVNGKTFEVLALLGKGKGGYSYLVQGAGGQYVLKQIHHEPCSYYQFGNKLEAEQRDYKRLHGIGIRMPAMLDVDTAQERILKEYIAGDTVYTLVREDRMPETLVPQMEQMCRALYAAGTNIDYFPTNFVVRDGLLYYIDFECNDYQEKWDFAHWGVHYWSKTPEFLAYEAEHAKESGAKA